ncbi:MAG: LysM peptidoglycan-binding domain-containing protein [Bacilli bacterium]
MKQTIPFKKDITFKTKIGELTAISLDNDLTLKGEDLIVGNFYISGNYKMLEGSVQEEEYSYKIPCEIAISDEYDTYDATIDIDDFYYEIINDEILRVNIILILDNLEKKENYLKEEDRKENIEILNDELDNEEENLDIEEEKAIDKEEKVFEDEIKLPLDEEFEKKEVIDKPKDNRAMSFYEAKEKVKKQSDTYLTYKVYIFKEEDTVESVLEKYNITKEELSDYNNLDEIMIGSKLVIPSSND